MKYLNFILKTLPFVLVFISSLYISQDPDLGWHLKYGEYFFKTGQILRDNTFSTMMPDFKWPNVSWGTDLITYAIFSQSGFLGLTILSSLVVTLTFYFFSKVADLTFWDQALLFPLLLFFENPVISVSFRGQLLSILMLGILFYLITQYEKNQTKKIFLAIPLILVWINLHGQSVLGLILFLSWIILHLIIKKLDGLKTLALVFVISVGVTFINPFGGGVYIDAFSHFGNPQLQNIAEYLPFDDLSVPWWNQVLLGILLLFGFIFLAFTDSLNPKIPLLGITSLLFGLSFLVRRYAWSLYFLTLPILKPLSEFFKPQKEKNQNISAFVILSLSILIAISLKNPISLSQMSWDTFCSDYLGCSKNSAQFLIDNKLTGNLLTFYDWGGWLIWNYPEIKPSIDGRMHLWKDKSGYSAFEEYYPYEQNFSDIDKSKYDVVLMSPQKPVYERLEELAFENKWKKVFEDENSGVFVRIKN